MTTDWWVAELEARFALTAHAEDAHWGAAASMNPTPVASPAAAGEPLIGTKRERQWSKELLPVPTGFDLVPEPAVDLLPIAPLVAPPAAPPASPSAKPSPSAAILTKRRRITRQQPTNTLPIIMRYMEWREDLNRYDATNAFSKECYTEWLQSRKAKVKNGPDSFRRAIMSHITGQDGRKPFAPKVEEAILRIVRKNEIWDCFQGTVDAAGRRVQVGLYGFRGSGYWETRADEERRRANPIYLAQPALFANFALE
eukprot:CAMPEP_0202051236 /NCGR_PEP_ID=MMETSP0963-20130614/4504_1 /ASSEMBLY_ACC=CAM_ASM_000494 /TAXON_ID=4773 /ORGANISM="Schizochytrium aggregatum, Strain ATCC28209" /LENGTH=254 /DNA_ID=CAMNT_0048616391 /DNA_START=66 /DNA_END=830 /DNA_ORIENTATION=-